jgi:hypothetical protein
MKARADKHCAEVVYNPGDMDAQYEKHEARWAMCKKAASIISGTF